MTRQGMLKGSLCALCLFAAASAAAGREEAPDTARSENFLIDGPSTSVARRVAERAEHYRREIALAWFGRELPNADRESMIFVAVRPEQSVGRSLLAQDGRANLTWLTASLEEVTGTLLAHEVAHVVMAYRFADRMPHWANEGIASQYDNPERHAIRARILRDLVVERRCPTTRQVMDGAIRSQERYAAATALTEFFLQQSSRSEFLDFVEDGARRGWERALADHYEIASFADLDRRWHRWLGQEISQRLLVANAGHSASIR